MTRQGLRTFLGGVVGAVAVAVAIRVYGGPSVPDVVETSPPAVVTQEARVRVEILNAGGVSGMAREATRALRSAGFDVVDFGNLPAFDPDRVSEVIDRVGRTDLARAVAEELGIDNVQSDPNPNLYVDVSVLLGREWAGPNAGSEDDDAAEASPWWDPRGWFG